MAVVLGIHSASYSSVVNAYGDKVLSGARCATCTTETLRLTCRRVHRDLVSATGRVRLAVAVAKCSACGRRERVLPFDAMPGKRFDIEVTFAAVSEIVTDGKSLAAVAREHGVTRRALRQWVEGVGARALDLERLYHHRAQTAPCDAPAGRLLVRWSAAAAELVRPLSTPVTRFVTDLRRTAKEERVEAARCLLVLLARAGGACAAASCGASQFRQAVLLFRPPMATRQVPPEFSQSTPVPGSRLGDRNLGTGDSPTHDGSPCDPTPSSKRRAQAGSRTGAARRRAARAKQASWTPPSTPLSARRGLLDRSHAPRLSSRRSVQGLVLIRPFEEIHGMRVSKSVVFDMHLLVAPLDLATAAGRGTVRGLAAETRTGADVSGPEGQGDHRARAACRARGGPLCANVT
jgi:transposase-like protein